MKSSIRQLFGVASLLLQAIPSSAQTYTSCNPLTQGGCPANSALGRTVNIDFRQGPSDSFTATGSPTYDSNGASFTVRQSGDSPVLMSRWYIMFGKVSVTLKAAHGTGIVVLWSTLGRRHSANLTHYNDRRADARDELR